MKGKMIDIGDETNLSDVDVVAGLVDLGVVQVEDGRVEPRIGGNDVASVQGPDSVGGRAVLASVPKADGHARHQVGAGFINDAAIDRRQLITAMISAR